MKILTHFLPNQLLFFKVGGSNLPFGRLLLREKNNDISGLELTDTLKNYAQTGTEYIKILNQIIRQNRLTDFEPVRLLSSVKKGELSS